MSFAEVSPHELIRFFSIFAIGRVLNDKGRNFIFRVILVSDDGAKPQRDYSPGQRPG